MDIGLIALLIALATSAAIQFGLVAGFVLRLRCWRCERIDDAAAPKALVILCLRGGDPFLSRCIRGLVSQDYPDYEICFLVDSADDPARAVLQRELASHDFDRFEIQILSEPLASCSLKCSSLVQALQSRLDSQGFVALLDADTIPHRGWLRELATALHGAGIGAATGNRWYMPETISMGAMTRHAWNAAAVVQMYWYSIAWGGTLAIKFDCIRRAKLMDRWRNALCEDTMLCTQLKKINQRIAFVPSLMMVNREDCSLPSFYGWVKRQLLTARLYHPLWFAVVGHGVSSAALLLWGGTACIGYAFTGRTTDSMVSLVAMLTFHLFLSLMLPWMESAVSRIVRARGESADWNRGLRWWQLGWYVWTTQWIYTAALMGCLRSRRIDWRGIDYDVRGPFDIRMLGYRPFRNDEAIDGRDNQSL